MFSKKRFRLLLLGITFGVGTVKAQNSDWVSLATNELQLGQEHAFCIYIADVNNDHYPDLITINSDLTDNPLCLYINTQATGSSNPQSRMFVNVTGTSGMNARPDGTPSHGTIAVAFADINNDGNVDMVRGNYYHRLVGFTDVGDRCEALLGDGQGHFTLVPNNGLHELGLLNDIGFSFLDYNKDGNIDLFIPTWFKDYDNEVWTPGHLMKGNGDGTFTNVSAQAGIATPEPMYGSSVIDWNNDGWPDIATAPYCRTSGQLLKNNGNGTFTDMASSVGYNARYLQGDNGQNTCMWNAVPEDFDNDGDMDLFFSLVHGGNDANEGRSAVVLNGGASNNYKLTPDRSYVIKKQPFSSHNGDYDASWFDMENDGLMDLMMLQGTYTPTTDRLFIFHHGADNKLTDVTADLGLVGNSRLLNMHLGEAFDYDLDGDDDLVVCRTANPGGGDPRTLDVIKNKKGQDNNWVGVKLRAPQGVNKSSIGARIYVWSGGVQRMREVYAGRGNASGQQPFAMLFGLGSNTFIDSIKVQWPDAAGTVTKVTNIPINRYIEIAASGLAVSETEKATNGNLKLYPNPATDFTIVQIDNNDVQLQTIEVYSMLGQLVQKETVANTGSQYISVKNLPPAQYILKAQADNGAVYVQKFIKQ